MSARLYGQDPPPPVTPPPNQTEKEKSESENSGEEQDVDKSQDQEETEQTPPKQQEEKKAEAPPESGDDIESHLEETGAVDADDQDEEKPSGEEDVVSPIEKVVKEEEQDSGDNVGGSLKESGEIRSGLLEHGPITDMYRLWKPFRDKLFDDTGINIGMAYTTLFQAATDGKNPREGWSGDFDIFGKWILLNRNNTNTGSTGFLIEQRHRFTEITPNALNDNLGGLWRTTRAFDSRDWALPQIWWEQYLFEDHVKVVAGKIDPANYYNGNRFQSQNTFFLNQAFSDNPARAFPDNGLGVNVRLAPSENMYFSFGTHDTNNSHNTSGLNHLDKDELFYAVEIGLTPKLEGRGPGRYRFTGWYTGAGKLTDGESGKGFALSFDQDLGNDLVPFFRYGYQDDNLVLTKQIVVGGLGVLNPFGRKNDVFGIGFTWAEASDSTLRDQYVTELFYRHQFTPKIQFTPGFQVIFDPSLNPDEDVIGVFEFRIRVVF